MKKYIVYVMSLLLMCESISAAIFTVENFTKADIVVELRLKKTWGSSTIRDSIAHGKSHRFDTGIYGIGKGGISGYGTVSVGR